MKKSWGLTSRILSGNKRIESRWYKFKRPPWNTIKAGDTVYFKDSGEPVTVVAEVRKVLQFPNLTNRKIREIFERYGGSDGIGEGSLEFFINHYKDRKYCIPVFLKNPKSIASFNINKKGFGAMSAWISIGNVENIKVY